MSYALSTACQTGNLSFAPPQSRCDNSSCKQNFCCSRSQKQERTEECRWCDSMNLINSLNEPAPFHSELSDLLQMHRNAKTVMEYFSPSSHNCFTEPGGNLPFYVLDVNRSKLNFSEHCSGKGKTVNRLKTGATLPDVTSKSSLVKALLAHTKTQEQ